MLLTSLSLAALSLAATRARPGEAKHRDDIQQRDIHQGDFNVNGQDSVTGSESAHNQAGGSHESKPQPGRAQDKVSAEFAARLARLPRDEQIRVIVLTRRGQPARQDTDAYGAASQAAFGAVFSQIDGCLTATAGRRLTERPTALGHVVVETDRRGIHALAELEFVSAILEDQAIHLHRPVEYPGEHSQDSEPSNE